MNLDGVGGGCFEGKELYFCGGGEGMAGFFFFFFFFFQSCGQLAFVEM